MTPSTRPGFAALLGVLMASTCLPPSALSATPELDPGKLAPLSTGEFAPLFEPFQTEFAALSPDGRYVAYSVREGETLFLMLHEIANPAAVPVKAQLLSDREATPFLHRTKERTVASIRWMKWVAPKRLVVLTNRSFSVNKLVNQSEPLDGESAESFAASRLQQITQAESGRLPDPWVHISGEIVAIDADGTNPRTLLTPMDLQEVLEAPPRASRAANARMADESAQTNISALGRGAPQKATPIQRQPRSPEVLDLLPADQEHVLVRARGGANYDLYKLNVHTAKLRHVSDEVLERGMQVVLTRQGKPGVVIRATTRSPFPHEFMIERRSGLSRWTPLDKVVPPNAAIGFSVSPETFFGERSIPLGFDEDPNVLYFASNVGRDTYGFYALDLRSGTRREESLEHPTYDLVTPVSSGLAQQDVLVYDRYTRALVGLRYTELLPTTQWFPPKLQQLQKDLERSAPGKTITLLEWDEQARIFLLKISGPSDAGGFYVLNESTGKAKEFARRAPWIDAKTAPRTTTFETTAQDGTRITGLVTLPFRTRIMPMPVVVKLPADPWARASLSYDPEVQAIAQMGFAVIQVNARGAWGFGRAFRDAVKNGYESVQAEDILAALDHVVKTLDLNGRRVALFAKGRGTYVALRAAQAHPKRFRCVVSLEGTVDVEDWVSEARWESSNPGPAMTAAFFGDKNRLKGASLLKTNEPFARPVLLLNYTGPRDQPVSQNYLNARRFASTLRERGVPAEFADLDEDYAEGLPRARSDAFRTIEAFLNEQVYSYDVDIGDTEVVPDTALPPLRPLPAR